MSISNAIYLKIWQEKILKGFNKFLKSLKYCNNFEETLEKFKEKCEKFIKKYSRYMKYLLKKEKSI